MFVDCFGHKALNIFCSSIAIVNVAALLFFDKTPPGQEQLDEASKDLVPIQLVAT